MRPARLWTMMLSVALSAAPVGAEDVVTVRLPTLELARDIAWAALEACRKEGYQVGVVVVDRAAVPQVVLRDVYAPRATLEIAEGKANAVILSGVSTREFAQNRSDILDELNLVEGVLILRGGVPIRAAGALVGAIGVSGAPGGDKDEACALEGIESVAERLEFIE